MNILMRFLFLPVVLILFSVVIKGQAISGYQPVSGWGMSNRSSLELIVLRQFEENGRSWYLAVNPLTLDTEIISSDSLGFTPATMGIIRSKYSDTPYIKALKRAALYHNGIQNAGFRRFSSSQPGIVLTADLCPSHHPLDSILFKSLLGIFKNNPAPIGISVSGRWINEHPMDLKWLDSLDKAGKVRVTWINHSYNHFTFDSVPLRKNFLLAPGTDIKNEVLNTEELLLENRIVPSIFFRFPGLVSNSAIYEMVIDRGLIPLGSDAWLAKGQHPQGGSIVLIHANGNEHKGVVAFLQLLKKQRQSIISKKWGLFDLKKSLIELVSQ